jgi:hypothetical protein
MARTWETRCAPIRGCRRNRRPTETVPLQPAEPIGSKNECEANGEVSATTRRAYKRSATQQPLQRNLGRGKSKHGQMTGTQEENDRAIS